jgi:hypothetical protein
LVQVQQTDGQDADRNHGNGAAGHAGDQRRQGEPEQQAQR